MANGNSNRQWLEKRFEALEKALRANVADVWSRLVTMVQAAEKKVESLQERLQSHEIRLTAVEHRLEEGDGDRDHLDDVEARLTAVERKTAWMPDRTDTGRLRHMNQEKARRTAYLIDKHFNENELRELCMDFQLDYENIEGETKKEKALELTMHFHRRNTLEVLISWLGGDGMRPGVDWPDVYEP